MAVFSGILSGSVPAMPSKSMSHRAVISAALAHGESTVSNILLSDDISATAKCVQALGAQVDFVSDTLRIKGITGRRSQAILHCGESGSTYRMLYPAAPLIADNAEFILSPSLARRPMQPIMELLKSHGVDARASSLSGRYSPGSFSIPGNISSQFISGLIFALSMLHEESRIIPTTEIQGSGYIEMTRACIHFFGGDTAWKDGAIIVRPANLHGANISIPGDFTHAAMYLAAGAVYGNVTVTGLALNTLQGDAVILDILSRMGAAVEVSDSSVSVSNGHLIGTEVDAGDTPDIIPAVAVVACAARGETRVFNASRLRLKESDRIAAIVSELSRLGADIRETEDGFIIRGGKRLCSGSCSAHNDHRIAMMLSVMGGLCGGVEIDSPHCVSKSAPRFFDEFTTLGGKIK